MSEVEYNRTSEEKYRKFPVNWLPDEFIIIKAIANEEYNGCVAQYIRRTVKRDLRERGLIGPNAQTELFREYIPVQVERHRIGVRLVRGPACEFPDPPRKFMGFVGGLKRNSYVYRWFMGKTEKKRTT